MSIGSLADADGHNSIAIGAGSKANGQNSIAIGAGSITTRDNQLVLGDAKQETTITNLNRGNILQTTAIKGSMSTVMANQDGTLKRTNTVEIEDGNTTINGKKIILGDEKSSINAPNLAGGGLIETDKKGNLVGTNIDASNIIDNTQQISINTEQISDNTSNIHKNRKDINKLKSAARSLGDAAEAAGAMGAALSGIPEVSLLPDEPIRCGIAGGGYGSQYAIAGGCAARIQDSLHINGAIAYSPTVDYHYGSTSSLAGRLGISFPLGGGGAQKAAQPAERTSGENWMGDDTSSSSTPRTSSSTPPVQPLWYRTEVSQTIAKLQDDVSSRDEQIDELKTRLEQLIDAQESEIKEPDHANSELIALLQKRIQDLEHERQQSEEEDDRQNAQIKTLQQKLMDQETRFDALMQKLQSMLPSKP